MLLIIPVFYLSQIFLGYLSRSLERHIYRTLQEDALIVRDLKVNISNITWGGVWGGYLGNMGISASVYQDDKISLENVDIRSKKIYFSWTSWFKTRRLEIYRLEQSSLTATITENVLNDFRKANYPQYNLYVNIEPKIIRLTYNLDLFIKQVSLVYEGIPVVTGPGEFSIYPQKVLLSDISIPKELINKYGNKIKLVVPVNLPLPVNLKKVELLAGKIKLTWQEADTT